MDESQRTPWDGLVLGATLATLDAGSGYGLIEDGALGWRDGLIVYAGPRTGLPADPNSLSGTVIDLGGGLVTPGLVDCHTHLVFAGNRAGEFEQRLQGASYEDIARAGGGIVADSEPEYEYRETINKAGAMARSIELLRQVQERENGGQ